MEQFVNKLTDLVPTFRPYVEALWADKLEKERLAYVKNVERGSERARDSERVRGLEDARMILKALKAMKATKG